MICRKNANFAIWRFLFDRLHIYPYTNAYDEIIFIVPSILH